MIYFSLLLTILQVVGFIQYFIALAYMYKNVEYALFMFVSGTILFTTKKMVNEIFSIYYAYTYRSSYSNVVDETLKKDSKND